MSGIYQIVNRLNGKMYVGRSVDVANRFLSHQKDLAAGKHGNFYLQRSYNKYGAEVFSYELLEKCAEELLPAREAYYIELFDCRNPSKGYNLASAKAGGKCHPFLLERSRKARLGRRHSPETCLKMSLAKRGKPPWNLGVPTRESTRQKLRLRPISEELRERLRQAHLGQVAWNRGIARVPGHPSEKYMFRKGHVPANLGVPVSPASKEKIRNSVNAYWEKRRAERGDGKACDAPNKGRSPSAETRRKMSEAHKRRLAAKKEETC